jgi:hypothetical protein
VHLWTAWLVVETWIVWYSVAVLLDINARQLKLTISPTAFVSTVSLPRGCGHQERLAELIRIYKFA